MFNVSKLSKELRNSDTIIWYKTKYFDYITNGYFAVKLDLNNYKKILGVLVEKFGAIPKINKTLHFNKPYCKNREENVLEMKKHDFINWIDKRKKTSIEKLDLYLKDPSGSKMMLGIFEGEDYVYINTKYLELFNDNAGNLEYEGSKKLEPIFVSRDEEVIMILPVRMFEDNKYLIKKELSDGSLKSSRVKLK